MNTLCIDLGLKRVGVALCVDDKIAMPLNAVLRKNRNQASAEIKALIKEHNAQRLIIGVPKGGSSEQTMQKRAEHFLDLLEFKGEICFVDESFTSKDALHLGICSHKNAKKDGKIDSLAALIMLKEFLRLV